MKTMPNMPALPGVYLFKNIAGDVIYVGKAKNLKKRLKSYLQTSNTGWKARAIVTESNSIEHIVTNNELEAMLLEARLIKTYQPQFNILLKAGQPFLYLLITNQQLPELKIVRSKKEKGSYFGPFMEKSAARSVYNFLIKTFQLKLCKKKIPNGCLYYHMGMCAGSCRGNFNKEQYLKRLELAKKALSQGHKKFLKYLQEQVKAYSKSLQFEKAKEFHEYVKSFESVFNTLTTNFARKDILLNAKHIWLFIPEHHSLFLFKEANGLLKELASFHILPEQYTPVDYFSSYYHMHTCPNTILTNFVIDDKKIVETFLQQWHQHKYPVSISDNPSAKHFASLLKLATIHAQNKIIKQISLAVDMQKLLHLTHSIHSIDCFDISHNQGHAVVGSCVRFVDGSPDKNHFRRFIIKTVSGQDDYASLREIVSRRYKNIDELPDLILIDGGKGQLNAVQNLFSQTTFASLAKREETIFSKKLPNGKKITPTNNAGQTLIALRDYTHHFAISFHRLKSSQSNNY